MTSMKCSPVKTNGAIVHIAVCLIVTINQQKMNNTLFALHKSTRYILYPYIASDGFVFTNTAHSEPFECYKNKLVFKF